MPANAILFLTDEHLREPRNVVRVMGQARKHPDNPLLPLGRVDEWDATQARPWESCTVIYDEQDRLFKCWYAGTDVSTERWWASGTVLPGLGRVNFRSVCREGVRVPVAWKGTNLDCAAGRKVRFRVHLCGAARLWAMRIAGD